MSACSLPPPPRSSREFQGHPFGPPSLPHRRSSSSWVAFSSSRAPRRSSLPCGHRLYAHRVQNTHGAFLRTVLAQRSVPRHIGDFGGVGTTVGLARAAREVEETVPRSIRSTHPQ